MEQVLRVWDSLLADPQRFLFMYCIGIALMEQEKEKLSTSDFAEIISCLLRLVWTLTITCKFSRI